MPEYLEGNPCMYEYLYLLHVIVSKSLALQVKNKTSPRDAFALKHHYGHWYTYAFEGYS